jgi:type II secretory pathway component PulC
MAQVTPPFLLVGVIMSEAGESMAILEDPRTHEQELHPLGAQIGGVHLTRILRDRVILTSEGIAVEVRLAGSPPAARSRPTPVRIPPNRARRPVPR